jgi:hypothetical protein
MALIYLQSFFFHSVDLRAVSLGKQETVQISFANRSRGLQIKTPSRAFRAVDKILDNSRQNFFAHVRDLSNCEKIAIRATRIMPAR